MSENTVKLTSVRELYETLFSKRWPVWVGGILLGLFNILLFIVRSPWGASDGINNWGENVYKVTGLMGVEDLPVPELNLYGMLCIMLVLGSMVGALFAKEFAVRVPPIGEIIKGFIGGGLMAVGATVGIGCTIGSFFSGVPALSGGAIIFTLGLLAGTIIAFRYTMWEVEKLPGISTGKSFTLLGGTGKYGAWQLWLALVISIGVMVLAYSYHAKGDRVLSWFIIIGLILGFICQRSRFCIVASFRDPFMTGESHSSTGVMAGLIVGLIGFTLIKTLGVGAVGDVAVRAREMTWVFPHFWARAAIGGFIFGLGMTVAGGCAVGTLWRTGEGHVKLWFSALGFLLISPVSKKFIVPFFVDILPHNVRYRNYLPDSFGYVGSVIIVLAIIAAWYMFVKWNERTRRFSAF
jgi:uncharacterized membrane protein YedE/YeeE